MKLLIQRVKSADVKVEGEVIGAIDNGYMVLLGACEADTKEIADKMIKKMVNLRIFADAEGKTNLSLQDVGGSILLVSQFTLYADCKKGNRPSFVKAGDPKHANMIYEYAIDVIKNQYGIKVETGSFGLVLYSSNFSNSFRFPLEVTPNVIRITSITANILPRRIKEEMRFAFSAVFFFFPAFLY